MALSMDDKIALAVIESRIDAILPETYQDGYDDVQPTAMGSAALRFGRDGRVAWNDMWTSFCDLAMAGGPPHKGQLLEPGVPAEIDAQPERYRDVVNEICRGVQMVTGDRVLVRARGVPQPVMRGLRHDRDHVLDFPGETKVRRCRNIDRQTPGAHRDVLHGDRPKQPPSHPVQDPSGQRASAAAIRAYRLAGARGVL